MYQHARVCLLTIEFRRIYSVNVGQLAAPTSDPMLRRILTIVLIGAACCASSVHAFAPSSSGLKISSARRNSHNPLPIVSILPTISSSVTPRTTTTTPPTTSLAMGRQWNFNNGRGPWGLKKNAEIWNGRVAQMAFVIVLLQEAITGKGVVDSVRDGDAVGYVFLGVAGITTIGLTIWLAIKGDESEIIFTGSEKGRLD